MSFLEHHKHLKKNEFNLNNYDDFWKTTKYKNLTTKTYDMFEHKFGRPDHHETFLADLLNYSNSPNATLKGVNSKVDPTLLVTDKEWVVSLIRKGGHALIALESQGFGSDEGLCLRWFDFITKDQPGAPRTHVCFGVFSNIKVLENRAVNGMVRYCPTNDGHPLKNIPAGITKNELFSRLKWNENSNSWICSPENVKAMLDAIEKDFILSDKNKLKFKFCGHSHPNCTSWTWPKLKKAGIDAEHHSFLNLIAITATNNIGSKRHSR